VINPFGAALAERWNGRKWSIQPTPGSASAALSSISCTSGAECIAVGSYAISIFLPQIATYAEEWNGAKWSVQTTPNRTGSLLNFLSGVSCPAARTCFAVGDNETSNGYATLVERYSS
jgi:hypothetical protein